MNGHHFICVHISYNHFFCGEQCNWLIWIKVNCWFILVKNKLFWAYIYAHNFVLLMTDPLNFLGWPTGKCCVGKSCKFPRLKFIGEHKCPKCHRILYVLCVVFSLSHGTYMCQLCYKYNTPTHTPVLQEASSYIPSKRKSEKVCWKSKQTDHQRSA